MWPDNRLINLFDIALPIIQAPMARSAFSNMVVAVSEAGGLGSLACALVSVKQARGELESIRRKTSSPINVNFFCHQQPRSDPSREMGWRRHLDAYYIQLVLLCCAPWKDVGQQWVQVPSGNWFAPPGSNRSSGGGNEAAEAFDVKGRYGDSANVQAVT